MQAEDMYQQAEDDVEGEVAKQRSMLSAGRLGGREVKAELKTLCR
jgi:hypothetical protein